MYVCVGVNITLWDTKGLNVFGMKQGEALEKYFLSTFTMLATKQVSISYIRKQMHTNLWCYILSTVGQICSNPKA